MNPVEDFLSFCGIEKVAVDDLRDTQGKELEMWHTWNNNGRTQEHMRPLLNSIRPLIQKHIKQWSSVRDVPPAAIKAEFTNQAVKAFESFDPNRGVKLSTFVTGQMRQAQRFITTYQNTARIPESRIYSVGAMNNAEQQLSETLGRSPTQLELADKLQWSTRKVGLLQSEVKKSYPASQFASDAAAYVPSRQQEVLKLLPYELSSDERAVFEHIYGLNGKQQLSPGAIATKLNMSAPKVSRLKSSIAEKYEKYIK
ncbi:FliA DNA-directed RNA polymerase specialized sigma subunit [uncultured Caudovirales phage]|uniref:FliA DNA-directed RNA polymerase specialized sigma subunit n=1 Tax=uncultured Caudovirales phage TaxID=2100421 RepID=A0A6J5LKX9_9CAUD|nr:FliA DNA-directed RNA polymerase specialized sigma subunit [uncultured Caudovirales phage]CAB4135184.1 FliA DNA-directed RNA polymerase specialized sigma subunit [uncultured Caudovirales phage]